ncbi:MAG: PLP-dependent aminotransferase family protein [Coxiellaceae bacterium]|nr:PLP-dependent aminotransferase family protein [Coxiellaceae bacterium]
MAEKLAAPELYDVELDHESDRPLYQQLYAAIRQQILAKRLLAGMRIPASRELAKALQVSRNTVQRAIDQLLTEGYIEAQQGSGVFISAEIPDEYFQVNKPTLKSKQKQAKQSIQLSSFAQSVACLSNLGVMTDLPFTPGMSDLTLFPQQLWLKLWHRALRHSIGKYMDENSDAGLSSLRQAISKYVCYSRAVNCQPEQVIITSGAQQALDLVCRVLLNRRDAVVIEDPAYMGMRNLLLAYEASILSCPVDSDGMQVDLLPSFASKKPRFIYTTPAHQYPLGAILPISRRLQLLAFAQQSNSYIIEDDYDGEFHFACKPLPSLQGMDQHRRVIYVGSFSKVLLPTLRLGYLIVPENLVEVFTKVKRVSTGLSEPIKQQVVADFINQGHFGRHLKRMRLLYAERMHDTVHAFEKKCQRQFDIIATGAGMHMVLMSRKKINDIALAKKVEGQGFACKALSPYYIARKKSYGLIVGFANTDKKTMLRGLNMIEQAMC